jgi:hypothetical protein
MFGKNVDLLNIQMSSSSLPSIQKPWRLTHCDGMGHVSKKLGLQDEVFTLRGQLNINVISGFNMER